MRRTVINLNSDWLYLAGDLSSGSLVDCDESGFVSVSIPHANAELPYHNFSEGESCFVSWYRKRFLVPADAAGRRVFLDFDGVMAAATVYINGTAAGPELRGGYAPFSVDVTNLVHAGAENLLAVRVDSTERPDMPLIDGGIDEVTFGGIYRDVALRIVDAIYIKNISAIPKDVLNERKSVDISATIVNTTDEEIEIDLTASIGGGAASMSGDLELPARGEGNIIFGIPGLEAELWELDKPTLYEAAIELDRGDRLATRIAFRTIEFLDRELLLNGRPIQPRGLKRHQTYPYIGAAAPARLQVRDALILKYDLACNLVRTSQHPQSRYFLDACDEIGLLVFEERELETQLGASHGHSLNAELYPATPFDPEERLREQALTHALLLDQGVGMNLANAIAFDFNTSAIFGSGDRICYYGVMDIFREPKFAAHFYAAFADPADCVVLEPATYWKPGTQSGSGPLVVFGNVDEIEVLLGDGSPVSHGRFKPRRDRYPRLARPPFIVESVGGSVGDHLQTLTIVGYIDGQAVATRKIAADGMPRQLVMEADDEELDADGADVTRVALRICDQFGNVLPLTMQPVNLSIEGPGTLVGDNPFPIPGGRGAVYVRATRMPGTIKVIASTPRLPEQSITIEAV